AVTLPDAPTSFFLITHRQLHRIDTARSPRNAAAADGSVEYCKRIVGHGWLHPVAPTLMSDRNMGLENIAFHPKSDGVHRAVPACCAIGIAPVPLEWLISSPIA